MKQIILLVEDNNPLRENTSELLELNNYKVFTAADGQEGFEKALQVKPDLILCDILMPEMDGICLLKLIRANPIIQHSYFIFFSAHAQGSEIKQGLELGADDYLVKPFTEGELLTCLQKYNTPKPSANFTSITQVQQ